MEFYLPETEEILELFDNVEECTRIIKGGFKVVYKAKINKKTQAFKLAYLPLAEENQITEIKDSEVYKRVIRELDILKKCEQGNIVKLGSLKHKLIKIKENNYVSYSEEFIDGVSLHELIKKKYIPDEKELRKLFTSMLKVIQYIWNNYRYIHRDIKPINIMKTEIVGREFIILDFGLAYSLNESSLTENSIGIPGTLEYLAPEMLDSNFRQSLDYRCDLYNLALTVYEFATGKNPIAIKNDPQYNTLLNVKSKLPEALQSHRNDLSEKFCNLINQSLKKKPSLRPSNFEDLFKQLED